MKRKEAMKTLPNDPGAEEAVLGSVLIDPEALHSLDFLAPDAFYQQRHRWIYGAMRDLAARRQPVDLLTLSGALSTAGKLGEIGGEDYLMELVTTVPSAINVGTYARSVSDQARRRALIEAAGEVARLGFDESVPVDEALGSAEAAVFAVRGALTQTRLYSASQMAELVWTGLDDALTNKRAPAFPTGFIEVDAILGGLRRQSLTIIAARTGIGKTAWLLNIAHNLSRRGRRVLVFSLEMSVDQLAHRLLTSYGCVSLRELMDGRVLDDHYPALADALGEFAGLPIHVDDTPGVTPSQIRARALRMQMEHGLDAVFVDYVQLMHPDRREDSRWLELGRISAALKELAKELDIPVVTAAQLNREAEGQRPRLDMLRESGNLEHDADGVVFLYRAREGTGEYQMTEAIVAKNRHGPTGSADMYWVPERVSFRDIVDQEVR